MRYIMGWLGWHLCILAAAEWVIASLPEPNGTTAWVVVGIMALAQLANGLILWPPNGGREA